jgi:hypothetical protein
MKKIILTLASVVIATAAFSQQKSQVTVESKPVKQVDKTEVRVIKPKSAIKKGEPAKKQATQQKVVSTPPREEKKSK